MAKILLVEDDQFLREINTDILQSEGFVVTPAVDGEDALEHIKTGSFDMILMDVILPKISGFDVIKKAKEEKPIAVPIIFFTNSEFLEDKKRAADLGGLYVMKSSLTPPELVALVRTHLPKASAI